MASQLLVGCGIFLVIVGLGTFLEPFGFIAAPLIIALGAVAIWKGRQEEKAPPLVSSLPASLSQEELTERVEERARQRDEEKSQEARMKDLQENPPKKLLCPHCGASIEEGLTWCPKCYKLVKGGL